MVRPGGDLEGPFDQYAQHAFEGSVADVAEAMAAGVPVVASNIDGYASVITHGVDGLLVRPNDPMVLADALTNLVNDPHERARLAAAGRVRVEEYSWPRVAQQVLSYYERLRDQRETVEASRRPPVRHTLAATP